jgi:hypothetical protein
MADMLNQNVDSILRALHSVYCNTNTNLSTYMKYTLLNAYIKPYKPQAYAGYIPKEKI